MPRCAASPSGTQHAPTDDDFALERPGRVDAAEDLDQRRFAGAVLADETEDFAWPRMEAAGFTPAVGADRERDVVQRAHAGKLLADSP